LEIGDNFFWTWLPASGHSGGLLVGFRDSCFDVGVVHKGEFLISTKLVLKASRFFFEFVGVYGPTNHSRSPLFLQELEEVVSRATSHVLIAGDFNLITVARGGPFRGTVYVDEQTTEPCPQCA
jgi:hypothetical protein